MTVIECLIIFIVISYVWFIIIINGLKDDIAFYKDYFKLYSEELKRLTLENSLLKEKLCLINKAQNSKENIG